MKRYSNGILLLLLGSIMVGLIGCGQGSEKVVAEVGDYDITVEEFNDYFQRRVPYSFPTKEDEYNKRREILDSMIVIRLLIQGAYDLGIDNLDEINRVIIANKNNLLLDVLYNKHIGDKTEVSEAEIKEFYEKLDTKIRASHILVSSIDTANMLIERIKGGENFEKLAVEYSIDQSAQRNKGDLGYFVWGSMVDEFEEVAFEMEPGTISPPVKTMYGYHVIKLVDKVPNDDRPPFNQMKETIEKQIKNRKTMRYTQEYFENLEKKYPVTIETSTCEYILHKREQMYPPQLLKTLPRNDFDMEQLDRDEKELVLATYDGGQMTLHEYLTQIQNIPPQYKPELDDYDSLATIVFELKKMDILALEATREGLDNSKEFQDKLKQYKELNMADIMKHDSIPVPPTPDEGMIRQYYEEHPDEFTDPAQVHIYEILLSDEIKARKLVKEINSLEEFKERAMELTERSGKRADGGDMGYVRREYFPQVFDLAYKTPIGEVAGPVVLASKYSIFYVVDKIEPALRDYLGQKRIIIDKITRQNKNNAIDQWIDNRMKSTEITIHDDVLSSTIDEEKYAQAGS